MTVVQRLVRRNFILGGLAVLLLLVLVFRPAPTSALRPGELPELFPDLAPETARTIVLERAPTTPDGEPETLRLVRAGEASWQVESRGGYPASYERVRAFLETIDGAREKKVVTQRAETFGEYVGPDGWTQVQVLDAAGKPLAQFDLGKAADWPDSYIKTRIDGTERIVRAHNLTGDKIGLPVDHWVEARLWPELSLPLVTGIDVTQRPTKKTLSFKRRAAEKGDANEPGAARWEMVAPKTETAETMAIEGLIRAFTGMRLDDVIGVADGADASATYGLDKPTYRVVVYADAEEKGGESKYVLEIGKPSKGDLESPDAWYVRRGGDTWVLEVPTYAIAEFERAPGDFLPPVEEPVDEGPPAGDAAGDPDGDAAGDPDGDAEGDPDGDAQGSPDGD